MTLRLRLFLLLGGLVALLVAGQWWMVRTLSRELTVEVGQVAVDIGRSLLTAVGEDGELEAGEPAAGARVERKITVLHSPPPAEGQGSAVATHDFNYRIVTEGEQKLGKTTVVLHMDEKEGRLVVDGGGAPQVIPIPEHGIHRRVEGFGTRLLFGSLALLGLGVLAAAVVAHRVSAPLAALAAAARRVGEGELGVQSPEPRDPEVAQAVRAFNRMSSRLGALEAQARAMREREHLAELGEVARGLAHTLRNPLNALGLTVEELARLAPGDGASPGEPAELAETARWQIRRIDGSVRSLLVLAAEGAGAAACETVDLPALVQDVALEALQDARGRVRIEVRAPDVEPPRLRAVAAELRAMVQALVVNAVEASPDGATVRVEVGAPDGGASAGAARVTVTDDGPGLAPEVRARLFSAHVSTKPTGSGMGLFLCHRLATSRYGGSLELPSRERGTAAILTLHDREAGLG